MLYSLMYRVALSSILLLTVVACGGSDSSSGVSGENPVLVNRTIALTPTSLNIVVASTASITAHFSGTGIVRYISDNTAVATVNGDGVVTAVGVGVTTITVSVAADGAHAATSTIASVQVTAPPPLLTTRSIVIIPLMLTAGSTGNLNASLSAGTGVIVYNSSNPSVASVDIHGIVTAESEGVAMIRASVAADNQYSATSSVVTVTVLISSGTIMPSIALSSDYQLVWREEFEGVNGAEVSRNNWNYDIGSPLFGGSVWGNNENQYYTDSRDNSYLQDGELVIKPIYRGANVIPNAPSSVFATSARLVSTTDDYYNAIGGQPYGYYEIRAKITCIAGSWPAIWMLGRDGDWPARGEIDIMEWFGATYANDPERYASALHFPDRHAGNPIFSERRINNYCGAYHVYYLIWEEDRITTGINGAVNLVYDRPVDYSNNNWPFTQPAHFLLNIAVGGNAGGAVNPSDVSSMQMNVDYIRVWQDDRNEPRPVQSSATPRQILASQMEAVGNSNARTYEGGNVNVFANGNFNEGRLHWDFGSNIAEQNNNIQQRQSYGAQRANNGLADADDNFGMVISAPSNGSMNISSATHIVLQTGNGRPESGPFSSAISHMVYTVDLIATVGQRTVTCSADLALGADDRALGSTGVNPYAIHTFRIAITDFADECRDGGLSEILPQLNQVAVKVVGGKDPVASADQGSSDNSAVLLQVGWIGFISTDTSITADNATNANKLFASQVMIADDGTARSIENGSVTLFADSGFDMVQESFGTTVQQQRDNVRQRQSYGIERGNSALLSAASSFGITFNAGNDGIVNISQSSTLVIQMGNASFSNNSFSVFSIELEDGNNWCRTNQDVSVAKPTTNTPSPPIGVHGLRTYEIPLSAFATCSGGTISDVQSALRSVQVKVIAGEQDNPALTATNTLIHVGWIAFK